MKKRWNGFAVAGFVLSFFSGLLGLIFSIIGVNNASKYDDKGKGLAIAGIIISCIDLIIELILIIVICMASAMIVAGLATIGDAIPNNFKNRTRETVLETYAKSQYEEKLYKKEGTKKLKKNADKGYTFTVADMEKETPGIKDIYVSCDLNKTKVTIYPTKPYGISDYKIKTTLSCN